MSLSLMIWINIHNTLGTEQAQRLELEESRWRQEEEKGGEKKVKQVKHVQRAAY